MKPWQRWSVFLAAVGLLLSVGLPTRAVEGRGTSSARFGYGVRLDLTDPDVEEELRRAGALQFDWVAVDFDWAAHVPGPKRQPEMADLLAVSRAADQAGMNVLVSITHAPAWALSAQGPAPALLADLAGEILDRDQGSIRALELFPGANTRAGWGRKPDPAAYFDFFQESSQSIRRDHPEVRLVVGGLLINTNAGEPDDYPGLEFLSGLYSQGLHQRPEIIGLRFPAGSFDPQKAGSKEGFAWRHYEKVREVMLEHDHRSGLIWMTGFSAPAPGQLGTGSAPEGNSGQWLQETFLRIRSQLYIQTAFFAPRTSLLEIFSAGDGSRPGAVSTFIPASHAAREEADQGYPGDRSLPNVITKQLSRKTLVKKRPQAPQ